MTRKRNVTAESITEPKGKQTSLFDQDQCISYHKYLAIEYDMGECPHCGRQIIPNDSQRRLEDYE